MPARLIRYSETTVILVMSDAERRALQRISKYGYDRLLLNNTPGKIQDDIGTPSQVTSTRTVYKALTSSKEESGNG